MTSNYKTLGDYITQVDVRNRDEAVNNLKGISSVYKEFVKSRANMIGVSLRNYKIVETNQFAFNPNTARMGDKIPIALNLSNTCVVSSIYPVFKIKDTDKLDPEYLMMWFRRSEFDRYARFKSHGSAREVFSWEEMCNVKLPIPSIKEQRRLSSEFKSVVSRIELCKSLDKKLEEAARALYSKCFTDQNKMENVPLKSLTEKIGSGSTPKGGKSGYQTSGISMIRSTNVHDYVFDYENLAFIDENQAAKLKSVTVQEGDLLLNITGVSVARCCLVPPRVLPARVNQHVAIIRPRDRLLSNYLMMTLCSSKYKSMLLGSSEAGSTRQALTKSELEEFLIPLPDEKSIKRFNELVTVLIRFRRQLAHEKLLLTTVLNVLLSSVAQKGSKLSEQSREVVML